ncbi:MAG: nucleotidyltransferase domain-containing protein [Candidatus Bathyarchaeota archaeon]|nr:nucleotidyltransferase domain-containing protein [Candidatus Bathyarchaeota archaeon]MDW8041056.1 nucleotidyltransferase domain-containing protein [Nitrososphaerota archaeon]
MASSDSLRLRDRDAIVTREGLIFRVFGYTHPPEGFICDLEYAPSTLFQSTNPKAYRTDGKRVFYKFYEDEGWRFVQKNFPQHMVLHKPLGRKVVGVHKADIVEVRRPEQALKRLVEKRQKDDLLIALQKVLEATVFSLKLRLEDFGVFGSLLHGFYHPRFSDIDIIVYGREHLEKIRSLLRELYSDGGSGFFNEFIGYSSIRGKVWRYKNLTPQEFVWHQRRKLVYGVFHDKVSGRAIKVEFEPVKSWREISGDYGETEKITWGGWVKAVLRIKDDSEAPYMPSVYQVEPICILEGPQVGDLRRVISYLEEFRMQAWKDEAVYVEGNLEKVETSNGCFHQITLTYGPRYYEQVLKVVNVISQN